ncbi:unnamed protein product [Nesidiocoris tenuis]|uniref:Uncharacterized protein n=1 Tax=Nesidiocoris tenuis TaxID=355587 RepID=A0A6H5GPR0_9HEMI|nr:unnamed protein product [Nesidiocoris tenuis]
MGKSHSHSGKNWPRMPFEPRWNMRIIHFEKRARKKKTVTEFQHCFPSLNSKNYRTELIFYPCIQHTQKVSITPNYVLNPNFLVCFPISGALGDVANINEAIDQLLDSGRAVLRANGQDKIALPNLDKVIDKKIFGNAVIHGEFHANGGIFQDPTTIRRTGDVTMQTEGNKLTLTASLGMDLLAVDYGHYTFQLLAVHSEGSIHAACARNSLSAVITVVHDGNRCNAQLEHARVDDIGGFDVKMSGPGDLNKLGSLVIPWVLNQFDSLVKSTINGHLEDALRQAIKNVENPIGQKTNKAERKAPGKKELTSDARFDSIKSQSLLRSGDAISTTQDVRSVQLRRHARIEVRFVRFNENARLPQPKKKVRIVGVDFPWST